MQATKRVQLLHHELMRSGYCNANEQAVLNYIMTFSENCRVQQKMIAIGINKSVSTVRRLVNSLIRKGMITRRYTDYKRCILQIVPLKVQKGLLTATGKIKQIFKIARAKTKKLMKSSDRSPVSEHDRSSVSEPTRKETQEIKLLNRELKTEKIDIENKKKTELLRLKAWLAQQV